VRGNSKQGALLFSLAAGVILAVLAYILCMPRTPPDPIYQGHHLSFWLRQELVSTNRLRFELSSEASGAVRQIGTNALPLLLRRIEYRGGVGDLSARETVGKFAIKVLPQRLVNRLLLPSGYNPREAALGFHALGESATPAIPDLVRMVNSENRGWALQALCYIGPASVEPLNNAWPQITDENRRLNVLSNLGFLISEMGSNAPDFSPVAIQALRQDSTWDIRVGAIRLLEATTRSPEVAVPVLVDLLGDHESIVQLTALDAIAGFGTNAQQAVPRLQELAKQDKDAQVREKAVSVLKWIEPTALIEP
jgi:hypothetical protein